MRNTFKGLAALGVGAALVGALPMLSLADTLSAPTNIAPTNGATLTTDQLTIADWTDVLGSSTPITYQYESSGTSSTNPDGSFTAPLFQSGALGSPSISIASTTPGTYWWHARATDNMGSTSPWSAPFALIISGTSTGTSTGTTTPPVPLAAPVNIAPTDGATLTTDQWTSADWTDVTGSSTPITYSYESSNGSSTNPDGSFTAPLFQTSGLGSSSISTVGTPPGTYWWHARATDNMGSTSPWSSPFTLVVSATSTGTTTPPNGLQDLINALRGLQGQFPGFTGPLQALIDQLSGLGGDNGGGTTPPTGPQPSLDNNGSTISAGGSIDIGGRNFGHEETVKVWLNGILIATPHADGGGNFTTGSLPAPVHPGTYVYTATGATSGLSATAAVTVVL